MATTTGTSPDVLIGVTPGRADDGKAKPSVLITDAGERAALATCRALAAAGYRVSVATFHSLSVCQWSRSCSEGIRIRDPREDAAGFIADLAARLQSTPTDVLIPGSDFSLLAVSRHRSELDSLTHLGLPSTAAVEASFNRQELARAAQAAGLTPASSALVGSLAEAELAAEELGFPVVIKSISSTIDHGQRVTAGPGTRLIKDLDDLRSARSELTVPRLVQRAEVGRTLSFGGVMIDNRLAAFAASRYLRTWPPEAGNAAFSKTIDPDPGLAEAIEAMLKVLGWQGLFELELIQRADGATIPIDLNPRPYGSMALARAAGANLPAIWCDWLTGRVLPPGRIATRPGHRYRWTEADLRNMAWQARHGRPALASRVLVPRRRVTHAHFRLDDPAPALVRLLFLIRGKLRARRAARAALGGVSSTA